MTLIYIPTQTIHLRGKESAHYARILSRLVLIFLNKTEYDFINNKIVAPVEYDLKQDSFVRFDIEDDKLTLDEFKLFLRKLVIDDEAHRQSFFIHNEWGLSESDYQLHHHIDQQLYGKTYAGVVPIKVYSEKKIQEYLQKVFCNFDAWLVTDDEGQIIQKGHFYKNLNHKNEISVLDIFDQDDVCKTICFSQGGGRKSCLLSLVFGVLYTHRGSYQKRYVTKQQYQIPFVKRQMHQHHRTVTIEQKLLEDCKEIDPEFYDQALIEMLKGCVAGGDFDNPYLLLATLFADEKMPSYDEMKEYVSGITLQDIYQLLDK